jgi:hypothetical protein
VGHLAFAATKSHLYWKTFGLQIWAQSTTG